MKLTNIIRLMRPKQWFKNIFVFLPLFFHGDFMSSPLLYKVILAFVVFCFASSGIYSLNDYIDIDDDKKHPKKSKRPLASGDMPRGIGLLVMLICWTIAISISIMIEKELFYVVLLYLVTNLLYCLKLKEIAIIDVFVLALGFVLRVFAGGLVIEIVVTNWIILMTFLLALFLAFAKRRDDVIIYDNTGVLLRSSISKYNITFLNQVIAILASIIMVCYIMYSVSSDVTERMNCNYVYFTSIFVLAGLLRYMQITIVESNSGSPTEILYKDRFIQVCIIAWFFSFICILYI